MKINHMKKHHDIEARMNERVLLGKFGAMRTDDEATRRYYLVKWLSEWYAIQENTIVKGVEPQSTNFVGKLICNAVFWNPVLNTIDWYTPMDKVNDFIMTRLKQVLQTG